MDSYIDITVRKDPEFGLPQLMSVLYAKLHRRLVTLKTDRIGVSFPNVKVSLGEKMRLHGRQADLKRLMASPWLAGVGDHVDVMGIASVPADARHRHVSRVQAKSNVDRLRRRAMRRHGLDDAQARERIPDTEVQRLDLPFVEMSSASTGQKFCLFLRHGPLLSKPAGGAFNAYGLSAGATVPWF